MRQSTRRPPRRAAVALAGLLAAALSALTLAACGGSSGSVVDPVAQAATTSTGAAGYRLNFHMKISSPLLPAPLTSTGQGSVNVHPHAASLALALNFGNNPQIIQALGSSVLHMQELLRGTTIYMKLPASISSKIPGFTKPWIELDLAKAASSAGMPGLSSLLNNPASSDPSQFLHYLRATAGKVTKVGTQTVDGVQATHYRATIDLHKVPNAVPPSQRAALRQSISALERISNLRMLPMDVWIDGKHLVRMMQLDFGETVRGQQLHIAMQLDIPAYGPQSIPPAPPANQVTNLNALISGGA